MTALSPQSPKGLVSDSCPDFVGREFSEEFGPSQYGLIVSDSPY